jgi:hypothetical protein
MIKDARAKLSVSEARGLLGLTGPCAVDPGKLLSDAQMIVERNREMAAEVSGLAEQGLLLSPVWERGTVAARARLAVLPPTFRSRYFEGEGAEVLSEAGALSAVCDVFPWFVDDPVGACFALEDTLRTWLDDTAPTRDLGLPYESHYRMLSLLLADIARKGAGGLDTLEWLLSIGLPIADVLEEGDPPESELRLSTKRKLELIWQEERAWRRMAFGG